MTPLKNYGSIKPELKLTDKAYIQAKNSLIDNLYQSFETSNGHNLSQEDAREDIELINGFFDAFNDKVNQRRMKRITHYVYEMRGRTNLNEIKHKIDMIINQMTSDMMIC